MKITESQLRRIVRSELSRGNALTESRDDEEFADRTRREIVIDVAKVIAVAGIVFGAVMSVIGFVVDAIGDAVRQARFEKLERMYGPQRDKMYRLTVSNETDQVASVEAVYGGFIFTASRDKPAAGIHSDPYGPTVAEFMGGRGKIDLKSLFTGGPHRDSLIINTTGTVDPGSEIVAVGDIRSVSSGLGVELNMMDYHPPFAATHARIRVGDTAYIVPVLITPEGKQVTAISQKMLR